MQRVVVKYGAWGMRDSEGSARMVGRVLPSISKWSFLFDDTNSMRHVSMMERHPERTK
jgi:hypothetical protein